MGEDTQLGGTAVRKYFLFDANVIAGYYCPESTKNRKMVPVVRSIVESVRSGATDHFLYVPNLCIAEVFSTFMKYAYGKDIKHRLDERIHARIREQFQKDIHNAKLFYHYEVSRYHILAVNVISPIEHHFRMTRRRVSKKTGKRTHSTCGPANIVDQLIIAMGMHLVKIHGHDNVFVVTADERIVRILRKCSTDFSASAMEKLRLREKSELIGITLDLKSFPRVIDLKKPRQQELREAFGVWPIPVRKLKKKDQPKWSDAYQVDGS